MFGPVVPSAGPSPARIALVGECPRDEKLIDGDYELRRMLTTIGVSLHECFRTNVFSRSPPNNNISSYGTQDPSRESRILGPLTLNPITHIADEHLAELARLQSELRQCNPNVVVALGPTACWALLGQQGLNALRGSVHSSEFLPERQLKVVPTYHPSAVLRQWDTRVIALADLEKAHVESHSPELKFDNTVLWLRPSLNDLQDFHNQHMQQATIVATDVETKRGQITCVSFSPDPSVSLVIPFWQDGPEPSYWSTPEEEFQAWAWVKRWMENSYIPKVTQNGMYDIVYFIRHGVYPKNYSEDTMLAHHSLYSEMRKGLGFLGSIYTRNPSWKHMRQFSRTKKEEQLKRDD